MSRSAPERWPISSRRRVKSGISTRVRMRRRTRSALSASRRTGPAMVLASSSDSTIITAEATPPTFRIASRSAVTIWSMSSPWVESISAPWIARKRCTGTATETITSPRSLTRTMLLFWPFSAFGDLLIAVAVFGPEFAIERQVAAIEPGADRDHRALDDARLLHRRRRQFEAQHVAAAVEAAAVEDQPAIAVVDAGAGLGRRNQPPQHRRDAFRIDRKIEPGIFVRRAVGFAGLQVLQPVGIDGDGVGLDGRGGRDRAGDDLGLHQQALRPRVDQAGAELREVENARHQRDQAGEIQRNDAAGEAREGLSAKKNCPARRSQPSGRCQPRERGLSAATASRTRTPRRPRHSGLDQAAFDQAMAKTAGCFDVRLRNQAPSLRDPTPDARRRQLTNARPAKGFANQVSLKR